MKTILLAEDDPFISDVHAINFKKENFKVDIANDGQMVLDKINHSPVDLLILDIDLPKVNGCEILKILRADPKTKDLKVIVLSNYKPQDIMQKYHVDISSFGILKHFLKIATPIEEVVAMAREVLK